MTKNKSELILDISNYKITNQDTIVEAINNEMDYEKLKNYYNQLISNKEYENYENIKIIIFALKSRLNVLDPKGNYEEINPLNELLDIYVTLEDVYPLIKKYTMYKKLSETELKEIYAYLSDAITKLQEGFIKSESENKKTFEEEIIEVLMEHIIYKDRNKYEKALLAKYYNYMKSNGNESSKGITDGKSKKYGISGNPAPFLLSDNGISLTITIITTTIILGSLIAALLLVK